MKYAVTGSTGHFGNLAIECMLRIGVKPSDIVAVARSEEKARGLRARGVEVRLADYGDPASLGKALGGVDRLLLVSGNAVGQREAQHRAVIAAAKGAGVKLVAYTSLIAADTSPNPLAGEHVATERALKESGLAWVILRNNWYTDNYLGDLAGAKATGIIGAAVGNGKVASALREEYAEAAARALVGEGHAGKTYELAGESWDYRALARAAEAALGRPVEFQPRTVAEQKAALMGLGMDEGLAGFFAAVDASIESGSLDHTSGDLAKLLGRPPLGLGAAVAKLLA